MADTKFKKLQKLLEFFNFFKYGGKKLLDFFKKFNYNGRKKITKIAGIFLISFNMAGKNSKISKNYQDW